MPGRPETNADPAPLTDGSIPERHPLGFWAAVAVMPLLHLLLDVFWHRANEEIAAFPHGAILRGAFGLHWPYEAVDALGLNLIYVTSWLLALPFGRSVAALLATPALLYLVCTLLLAAVVGELSDRRSALFAAWTFALLPASWSLSRSFSWELSMLVLALVGALGWVRAWRRDDLRWAALPGLVSLHVLLLGADPEGWENGDNGDVNFYLGLILSLAGVLTWLGTEVALAGRRGERRRVWRGACMAALGVAPLLILLVDRSSLPAFEGYVLGQAFDDPSSALSAEPGRQLLERLFFYPTWLLLYQSNVVAALVGIAALVLAGTQRKAAGARLGWIWFGVAFAALAVVDKKGNTYFACALPGLATLVGIGVARAGEVLPRRVFDVVLVITLVACVEQAVVLSFEPPAHPRSIVAFDAGGAPARWRLLPTAAKEWDRELRAIAEQSQAYYGNWSAPPAGAQGPRGGGALLPELELRLAAGEHVRHMYPGHFRGLDAIRDAIDASAVLGRSSPEWHPSLGPADPRAWIPDLDTDGGTLVCPLPPDWAAGQHMRAAAGLRRIATSDRGQCELWGRAPRQDPGSR